MCWQCLVIQARGAAMLYLRGATVSGQLELPRTHIVAMTATASEGDSRFTEWTTIESLACPSPFVTQMTWSYLLAARRQLVAASLGLRQRY